MNNQVNYEYIREVMEKASKEVIGKTPYEARNICTEAGLLCRWISQDGKGLMITADCKMDRIGLVIVNGLVTETRNG